MEFKSWKQALPKEGLVVVTGHRRRGKTATVYGLAAQAHKRGRPVAAYRFPRRLRKSLPPWVEHVDSVQNLEKLKGYFIIADEMGREVHARNHRSQANIEWLQMLAIVAQCHHLLFAIYQHSRQVDVGLVADADLTIMKMPSALHLRFARPELRTEIEDAVTRFSKVKDPRKWCYVVNWHSGTVGFIKAPPRPPFWSDELSTAYALALVQEEAKRERRDSQKARRKKRQKGDGEGAED